MPGDHDSGEYTVMSYRSYIGGPKNGLSNGTWSYPQTLMMFDIAAVQALYGANFQTNSGNTTYQWDPSTGEFFVDGIGQGAPAGNRVFMTIWDGGGRDTYDFSNYTTNLTVNLQPGEWSTMSEEQLASLGYQRYAHGNVANALLYHNNQASLIEDVIGGSGDDVIVGNAADNALTGGQGDDFLDGGIGSDSAVYSGFSSQYSWMQNEDNTWTITDLRAGTPDGIDVLKNIQYLDFTDMLLALAEGDGSGEPGEDVPVAVDDFYATRRRAITVDVLANDFDPNSGELSTILVNGPSRGHLTLDEEGHFLYVSPRHFKGMIKFSYSASDGSHESEIAMVQIKIGRKHGSPHKVSKGSDLDNDIGPRHPSVREDDHGRGDDWLHHDNLPPSLWYEESSSPLRDDAHWLLA
jgi:hypothetical protein